MTRTQVRAALECARFRRGVQRYLRARARLVRSVTGRPEERPRKRRKRRIRVVGRLAEKNVD